MYDLRNSQLLRKFVALSNRPMIFPAIDSRGDTLQFNVLREYIIFHTSTQLSMRCVRAIYSKRESLYIYVYNDILHRYHTFIHMIRITVCMHLCALPSIYVSSTSRTNLGNNRTGADRMSVGCPVGFSIGVLRPAT